MGDRKSDNRRVIVGLLKERFVGCMVGCAIGDALGASFEGLGVEGDLEDVRMGGRWTDDTHMMMGVAESLIANRGFDGEHMTRTFIENWGEEPWRGYGPGPPAVFRMIQSGVPFTKAAKRLYGGMGSFGNGAAMRVAPVGLLYCDDVEKLRDIAYKSSEITHTHELGREGAAIQAYSVALASRTGKDAINPEDFLDRVAGFTRSGVYREKLERAKGLLDEEDRRGAVRVLGNTVEAFNSVPTSIYCFAKNYYSYVKAVSYAVSLGGDTDTIGAMTGAIAGAYHGEEALPDQWTEKLEKVQYIKKLARALCELKASLSTFT